jgi:2-polyprenyl-3-methyl-5-hydroxy-6-metoxy-1,4-benzoquinol methylase
MSPQPTDPRVSLSTNLRKYQTGNPLMLWFIRRFLAQIRDAALAVRPTTIVDIGCGEGIVGGMLCDAIAGIEYVGLDVSPTVVETARTLYPHLDFRVGSVFDPAIEPPTADLAVCLEVIEHVEEPGRAVANVMARTRAHALVSVPWEPWFRLGNLVRGRHVRRWGNHPEHVQRFDPDGFRALLAPHAAEVRVWTCFPWIIGLARRA